MDKHTAAFTVYNKVRKQDRRLLYKSREETYTKGEVEKKGFDFLKLFVTNFTQLKW